MRISGLLILVLLLNGCAIEPPVKTVTTEERIRMDDSRGVELAAAFESQLNVKKDVEVSVWLRNLAQKLTQSVSELQVSPVGVILVRDRDSKWKSFALPGIRIWLSIGLLKNLQFENEVAALIALQLGHVLGRHAIQNADRPVPHDWFGPAGIFAFSEKEILQATESAVGILYGAGYDPRGLVSLWLKFQESPKHSPYEPDSIPEFLERARLTIAAHAPLRNPVVRSEEYVKIKKRLERL